MKELIGQTINQRYQINEFLGRGGMADVYKVWDTHRQEFLAAKILRDDLSHDVVFLKRFEREARTLAKLQHPNIVRFYGLEQDGMLVAMLMDYIEGESLREVIFRARGRGLSEVEILGFIQPVCKALHYAHQQGVTHCDLKPGNILIDRDGKVYNGDFGIARHMDAATMTMVGAGTPAYMAPELVQGREPTPQSDIYSLGIVLYEMLTGGERPFTGERAAITGTTAEKVRWEQVRLAPESPRKFNKKISPEMEAVVMRCLEKDPVKRFTSPMELRNALRQIIGVHAPEKYSLREQRAESQPIWKKWPLWAGAAAVFIALAFFELKTPAASPRESEEQPMIVPSIEATIEAFSVSTSAPTPTPVPTHTPFPTPTLVNPLVIEIWNDYIDMDTQIDLTICNWDSKDQEATLTLIRPDGTQKDVISTLGCCDAWICDGVFRPAWKLYITPEEDELPGVWKLIVEGNTTGRTTSLEFTVNP